MLSGEPFRLGLPLRLISGALDGDGCTGDAVISSLSRIDDDWIASLVTLEIGGIVVKGRSTESTNNEKASSVSTLSSVI